MSILTGISTGVVNVLATDTIALTVAAAERAVITGIICHNDSALTVTVTFYDSPDDTSASGDEVSEIILAPKESKPVGEIAGQGYAAGRRIIAVGDATGVNLSITYSKYTSGDV